MGYSLFITGMKSHHLLAKAAILGQLRVSCMTNKENNQQQVFITTVFMGMTEAVV